MLLLFYPKRIKNRFILNDITIDDYINHNKHFVKLLNYIDPEPEFLLGCFENNIDASKFLKESCKLDVNPNEIKTVPEGFVCQG